MGKFYRQKNNRFRRNARPKNKRTNEEPGAVVERELKLKNLSEIDVGITEFVSVMEGFTGVLKARFSDFHVNEIDLDGNEVKLTTQLLPTPICTDLGAVKLEKNKKDLEAILTPEVWLKVDNLLKSSSMEDSVDINVNGLTKERREMVHKTLKEVYGNKIISTTDTVNNQKFISISKAKGGQGEKRIRWTWPGEYVHFVLHKENTDTVQAASDLASRLKVHPSHINYAGTKDKRAKTTQKFCVRKKEPEHILRSARNFSYLKVGNFEFKDKVLKLGELKGNRFKIALRHIDGDEDKIVKCLESIREKGFINYYGLQRFGNCADVPTYLVGIALCKSDYKQACELILKPRETDLPFLKKVRETWWENRNSAEAAAMIKSNKFIEKKLLSGLADFGENDYANSLRRIPRNMLMLYTHSFQSLIWNRIASKRIEKYGLDLLVGDLVFRDDIQSEENVEEIVENIDEVLQNEESAERRDEDDTEANDQNNDNVDNKNVEVKSKYKEKVRPLQLVDIKSGKYTIYDVLLPLPGWDVSYPKNETEEWYREALEEHGLTSEKLKNNVRTYSLTGAYRKLIVKPENMSWTFKKYDSTTSVLIASDFENLKGKKADDDLPDGKYKALLLDFTLPSSSYATMTLREILKADTSVMSQARIGMESELRKNEENAKREHENNSAEDDQPAKKIKI
ncbi:pseudouridylate synthase 7 homolog [Condylostylus longicornis]|uniref:pseudouridylate synthase 7 homolog n=1 Tax=Condylostylus longicornis TaxID=2530218 RepID=UPI00244E4D7C|nr:pseudouridylate synthase 7 homolog [Condylostylus longicornis]